MSNAVIKYYLFRNGQNDVYSQLISKEDVVGVPGSDCKDRLYDYPQSLRIMKFYDRDNSIEMDFVYLKTDRGDIIDRVDMKTEG